MVRQARASGARSAAGRPGRKTFGLAPAGMHGTRSTREESARPAFAMGFDAVPLVRPLVAAVADPEKMSNYFISGASGPLKAGTEVVWEFVDVGAKVSVDVLEVEENRKGLHRPGSGLFSVFILCFFQNLVANSTHSLQMYALTRMLSGFDISLRTSSWVLLRNEASQDLGVCSLHELGHVIPPFAPTPFANDDCDWKDGGQQYGRQQQSHQERVHNAAAILPLPKLPPSPRPCQMDQHHAFSPLPTGRGCQWIRGRPRSACSSSLLAHLPRVLVLPQRDKPAVPQVSVRGPFQELELRHQHRLKPSALLHLLGGEALPPPAAPWLWQVGKGAVGDFQRAEAPV